MLPTLVPRELPQLPSEPPSTSGGKTELIPNLDREPFEFEKEELARKMVWVGLWRLLVLEEKDA